MRVVKREIELTFRFTLGPGEPALEEADALTHLMALAKQCAPLPVPTALPKPLKRQYHLCKRPWQCEDCPSRGSTLRGSVLHRNAFPKHVVEFPGSGLEG